MDGPVFALRLLSNNRHVRFVRLLWNHAASRLTATRFRIGQAHWPERKLQNVGRLAMSYLRYDDEQAGILDGAIFGFSTNGTCPDLLVLIEAQKVKDASAKWKIAVARMTNCELHLHDQDREIWSAPFLRFADRLGENLDTWMFFWANEGR